MEEAGWGKGWVEEERGGGSSSPSRRAVVREEMGWERVSTSEVEVEERQGRRSLVRAVNRGGTLCNAFSQYARCRLT